MMNEKDLKTQERLLTEVETSALIGFSKNTLRAWRVTGRPNNSPPPPFIKCGRAVRYRLSELLAWMARQPSHYSTSDPGTTV